MLKSTEGFRLSPQQTNLWGLQQATAEQHFLARCAIDLTGSLNTDALKAALDEIVQRHEILRTTFQRPPGIRTPFQVVAETLEPSWRTSDITNLNADEQQTKIRDCLQKARVQPFDLEQGPLLRVLLLRLSDERHALIISLPSLCADSQTLANMVRELAQAYEFRVGGAELSSEPMQYADFAEWQNELLEAEDDLAREGKDYWLQQTASSPTLPLEKETTQQSANTNDLDYASVSLACDPELLRRIESLARAHEASVSSVLFTCWQALVWRLSGESDFLLYDLCEGRKFDDLKDALGLYARYLPVRCTVNDVPFSELLRATQSARRTASEWQEYFDQSAMAASARNAIVFEFAEQQEFTGAGLKFSVRKQDVRLGPSKLRVSLALSDTVLAGELHFDPQRFERQTIERLAGYFLKLAQTLDTTKTVGAIDILNPEENERLLLKFNQTTVALPTDKCIHELFESQAASTPDAIALVVNDLELTYHELNERANRLAHLLRRRGLAPNDRVGLCTERGAEMIIGLLGILKAGGAYVPLNPEHPNERLALQLAESKASLLVTAAGAIDNALQFSGETIDFTLHSSLLANEPQTNPASAVKGENLVYVIYTSGSTGVPKGVAVTQGNLLNYTQFILRRLEVTQPLQFASVSTVSADLGNTCIFPALASGGCLHLLSYEVAMSGEMFRNYTLKRPIDVLKIVPSHLNALLSVDTQGEFLPSQYLICGGEALSWELVQRIKRLNSGCRIINHYGPTETTVGSLTYSVDAQTIQPSSLTVPIGRPIANTRAFVLDRYLRPVPTGVAGELFIGGAGVANGYLNRPAETAARFVADPFTAKPGARLYRTGDLTRYLPDGNIEFLGRVDHQVKVRGFRVELGEIETVLASHPSVQQAVVVVSRDSPDADRPSPGTADLPSAYLPGKASVVDERLVAYIVSSDVQASGADELRDFLRKRLPDYMVPLLFVFLKSLPLTPNGKIDRAALPKPDDLRPDLKKDFIAPRTPIETGLARIWAGLLKVNEVGINDNFFDLGGHSLLATQVVSRMRQTFQVEISLRSLFESPTIAALAELIDHSSDNETARLLAELEELSEEDAVRLLEQEQSPLD